MGSFQKDVECPVCYGLLSQARILTPCGHSVCQTCVGLLDKCPLCRKRKEGDSLNIFMTRVVETLTCVCENSFPSAQRAENMICKAVVPLVKREEHAKVCGFEMVRCKICQAPLLIKDSVVHQLKAH